MGARWVAASTLGAGTVDVEDTTISTNTAVRGGGIYVDGDIGVDTYIRNSTVSGNTASDFGGGVYFRHAYRYLQIQNCTISGNTAGGGGGGVFSGKGRYRRQEHPRSHLHLHHRREHRGQAGRGVEAPLWTLLSSSRTAPSPGRCRPTGRNPTPAGGGIAMSPSGGAA